MKTILLMLSLALLPTVAQAEPPVAVTPSADLQTIVRLQLRAFDDGDAEAAWAPVSPELRVQFGTPEGFLHMVREGYAPLVNSQRVRFGQQVVLPTGEVGQWLDVTSANGERVRALYLFDQIDGRWLTTGCLLFAPDDVMASA